MTVQDLLELLEEDQYYMVCPYNTETAEILHIHVIDLIQDKILENMSDEYEKEYGDNYTMQEVVTFGAIRVSDVKQGEDWNEAYILILTNIIGGN